MESRTLLVDYKKLVSRKEIKIQTTDNKGRKKKELQSPSLVLHEWTLCVFSL